VAVGNRTLQRAILEGGLNRHCMLRVFNQYVAPKSIMLMAIESAAIALSLLCAARLRFWNDPAEFDLYVTLPDFALQCGIVVAVCVICFYCNDLYEFGRSTDSGIERVLRVEQSLGAASLLLGLIYFLCPTLLLSRGVFLIAMILMAGFVGITRRAVDSAWKFTAVQRTMILGSGELAVQLAREISRRQDLSIKLEGFVSAAPATMPDLFGVPILGQIQEIEDIVRRLGISRIIVALEDRRGALPARALVSLKVQGVRVDDAVTSLAGLTGRISLDVVRPSWFVFTDGFRRSRWNDLLKRVLDLSASIVGFVLSAPLMALVALVVRLDSEGPVIYRQTRVGPMGKHFEVLKFRSMRVDAETGNNAQWAQHDDPRVTPVGRFIRKYRLDELPQFINIIRGDMSFVGPRPERPCFVEELRQTIPYYDERHSVRPGLTGWAQVQYSYGSTIEDAFNKLEYDLFYLKNMSLIFDLAIIFKTIQIVVRGRGGR
jgi:sugar transferase (PEP-CTERM system associated)